MTEKFGLLAARSRRRQGSLGVTRRFAATRLLSPRARAGGALPALAAVYSAMASSKKVDAG